MNNSKTLKETKVSNKVEKLNAEQIAEATKQRMIEKRKLNPQFSHVVSKQKKLDRLNGITVFLNTKSIVKNIEIEGYNYAENLNAINECIKFINFATQLDKEKKYKNEEILKFVLSNVRVSKKGEFSEYYFSQLVQKIITITIKKKFTYNEAINYFLASKK